MREVHGPGDLRERLSVSCHSFRERKPESSLTGTAISRTLSHEYFIVALSEERHPGGFPTGTVGSSSFLESRAGLGALKFGPAAAGERAAAVALLRLSKL